MLQLPGRCFFPAWAASTHLEAIAIALGRSSPFTGAVEKGGDVTGQHVGDSTVLDMCEHALVARCPGVSPSQYPTFVPFRRSAVWVTQSSQRLKRCLLSPRRHKRQTLTACQYESQLDSHVCRRSVLALGVAGLSLTQRAQTADAETALPPELRKSTSTLRG